MAKNKLTENDLKEFTSDDGQSTVPDPVGKDAKRPADKTDGEKAIPEFPTKVEAMNAVMQKMAGMPKEAIADLFKGMTDKLDHSPEKAKGTRRIGGTAQDSSTAQTLDQTKLSPTSATAVASEDMDIMFDGEELSEDFRSRAKTIFEAAVNSRVVTEVARLEEEFDNRLVEALEQKIEQLSDTVSTYLSYAVEQWVQENEIAIETGLKAEIVDDFLVGLKNLFDENYIEIPDDKVDVVAELSQRVAEMEEKFNTVVQENIDLKDQIDTFQVENIFAEAVESLPMTQAEKLRSLVEGIEYSDVEEFTKKLNVIKETYFPEGKKAVSLTEEVEDGSDDDGVQIKASGSMAQYVNAISKTVKK